MVDVFVSEIYLVDVVDKYVGVLRLAFCGS